MPKTVSQRPPKSLNGRVVAVTGGARGIGAVTARTLAARGAHVAIGDIAGDLAKEVADQLPGSHLGAQLDVTDVSSFEAFLDRVEAELGMVDVLINNAGIMPLGQLLDESDTVTRRIIDINLGGVINGTKAAGRRMRACGSGHIVNVASAVGRIALPGAATYSASKYGVIGLTEATRAEFRPFGVEVSCVVPMIVNTELGAGLAKVRGQRTVEPQEVADAIIERISNPRFETWVPRSGHALYKLLTLLPKSWADVSGRVLGAQDILAHPDSIARTAYESRARGQSD